MKGLPSVGCRVLTIASAMGVLAAAALVDTAVLVAPGNPVASAASESCPDVDVIFARGTFEPPGIGVTGQAFVDALQARLPSEAMQVSPVDYPASLDFTNGASAGIADASTQITEEASRCPDTRSSSVGTRKERPWPPT